MGLGLGFGRLRRRATRRPRARLGVTCLGVEGRAAREDLD